jgi:predicted nuclease of predicted toxin-antitoxin system
VVRWLRDECVDAQLVGILRRSGHEVVYMTDVEPRAPDTEVMDRACREQRLLLTEDKDFGDLVFREARPVPGIVLLGIDTAQRLHKEGCWRRSTDSARPCSHTTQLLKVPDFVRGLCDCGEPA